jgi:hypothetical protein
MLLYAYRLENNGALLAKRYYLFNQFGGNLCVPVI